MDQAIVTALAVVLSSRCARHARARGGGPGAPPPDLDRGGDS